LICAKARIRSLNQSSRRIGRSGFRGQKSPGNAGKWLGNPLEMLEKSWKHRCKNHGKYVKIMENTWENNGKHMGTALEHMGKSWGSHLPV